MEIRGRERAPFSDRVWRELEATIVSAKRNSCTARYFLEVDGPWGAGLTSMAGEEQRFNPSAVGGQHHAWGVPRAHPLDADASYDPDRFARRGTFLVAPTARPVPSIHSEFLLGVRSVEAFDDDCQPLDSSAATRAARDVALEEERLIYYGNRAAAQPGLLAIQHFRPRLRQLVLRVPPGGFVIGGVPQPVDPALLVHGPDDLTLAQYVPFFIGAPPADRAAVLNNFPDAYSFIHLPIPSSAIFLREASAAIQALAARGFPGPYAMALWPQAYLQLHSALLGTTLLVELLRKLFALGIYMAPVIQPVLAVPPAPPPPPPPFNQPPRGFPLRRQPFGVIVAGGRSLVRLVVGQDWTLSYGGPTGAGVFHRFRLASSLRVEIAEPAALQVLRQHPVWPPV